MRWLVGGRVEWAGVDVTEQGIIYYVRLEILAEWIHLFQKMRGGSAG